MEQFKRQVTKPFSLSSEPQVPGYGPSGTLSIAFLGEAPGQEEALKGEPFVGPAGQFLDKSCCSPAKVWFAGSWKTNVIDRQPPTWNGKPNAINSPEAMECIDAQTDELWREIEWLIRSKKIKVLVAVGGTATLALGIKEPITKTRGSVYEISLSKRRALTFAEIEAGETADVICIPILHPSGLLRNRWTKKASGTMGDTLATIDDLKKVQRLAIQGYKRPVERFILRPTADEIVTWIQQALEDKVLVAVDTESKGDIDLEPSKRQLTIVGLARNSENAISISFVEEDGLLTWTNGSLERIYDALNLLFTTGRLMMQNALHDVPLIAATGFKIDPRCIEHDTLLLHHAVSPEDKHNLAYIVSRFGLTTYWKEEVEKKAFGKVYNLRDCVVLHQALEPLLAAAAKVDPTGRLLEVYKEETMKLLPSVIRMHQVGMGLDRKRLKMWQQFATSKLAVAETTLKNAAQVSDLFNFKSDQHTQALFFGQFPEANIRKARLVVTMDKSEIERKKGLEKTEQEIKKCEASGRVTTKKYADLLERRARLMTADRPAYYYEAMDFLKAFDNLTQIWPGINKWNGRKTEKKDRVSLSKKTYPEMLNFAFKRQEELNGLVRPTAEHEAEKAQLNRFIAVTSSYGAFSRVSHIVSTYYDFNTWYDHRVHGRLIQTGTGTGRLAARDPNLQNIPVREKWAQQVRLCLVSRFGTVFLLGDYENIEFVVYAYITGDPGLIKIVESGQNIHDVNVPLLFSDQGIKDSSHPLWKPARRAAKAYQFGRRQYGGGEQEVHRNMIADAPELEFTMKQFKRVEAMYNEMYPVAAEWDRYTRDYVRKRRRIESPFGRVRILTGNDRDIEKQGLNTGSQSGAAQIMNMAQLRVEARLKKEGLMLEQFTPNWEERRTESILQIHDQLILESPIEDVGRVAPIMVEEMTRPLSFTNWKGMKCTINPKVAPEFGLDMYDTVDTPLENGKLDQKLFDVALLKLENKKIEFTDTDVSTVDDDTFEGDSDAEDD